MRKNFRSDISIRESFYDYDQSGERIQSLVPENVRIEYFTPAYPRVRLVCSRNGDTFHNCSLSENGRVLVCNLALSRQSLGVGPLLKIVKYSVADSSFPYDFQNKEHIASTGIDLWGGPSDAGELESESVLSEVILRYGYSAYRLAVLDGFEGTEQEWLESLIGDEGKSAYQVAVDNGFEGTVVEWLASLVGPPGITPDISIGTVTTGQPGTPVVVTITGTPEAPVLNVTIPQGMQGNTGSSVAYPFELVNNLTTNDATKALSAAQGNFLDGKVSQLRQEIDGQDGNYLENMAVTQNDRIPVSAEGFGCSDFIPYTQGNSVHWKWGAGTNMKSLCFYDSDKQPITDGYWNGNTSGGGRTITASDINRYAPTAAYIRASFVLQYKDVATVTTGDVVWTPVDAVSGLSLRVSALGQAVEAQQDKIEELEQLDLNKIYSGQEANYEQGRISRVGKVYQDSYSDGWYHPTDFIPCQQGDVLTWESGENSANGTRCLCLYDENKAFINDAYWEPSLQPKSIRITSTYSAAKYVRFSFKLKKADTTENTTPLLINGVVAFAVKKFIPGLTPTDKKATEALEKVNQLLPTDTEHGIIGENYPSEVLVVENQLQAKLANRFHFIHISDNHGASFGYAQQYLDLSPAKFLINTGDLVADKFADKDLASFQTITLATEPTKPVYLALGNHDYSHATSRQAVFDAFIAPTNTHNGTAFDKTYYSLDFSTEKVKCIVLDMNDGWADADLPNYGPSGNLTWGKMSQTQINWLAAQLQDAITNALHVAIFIHTPPAQVSRFNRIKDFSDTINLDYARNLTFLPGLIDAFINGATASFTYDGNNYSFTFASGGHFVSWVCGHEHGDLCGWMDGHENQFIAVVCRPYRDTSKYSGSYDGDKLGVHWNYCTIDAERKSFAVYRMGQQTTIFGTDRVSFRILYK